MTFQVVFKVTAKSDYLRQPSANLGGNDRVNMTPPTDPVTGFHIDETGTYQVFSDCTGTFTINTPATSPVITVKFVLSDGGSSIHTVVSSLVLPGTTEPTPALIHSDGHRLGRIRAWWE
jgi:hypothetical protein